MEGHKICCDEVEKKSWEEPVGYWNVTTEGDIGGRGTYEIGTFKGHYIDIAFAVADQCMYNLYFKKIPEEKMILPNKRTKDQVKICFNDGFIHNKGIEKMGNDVSLAAKEKGVNVEVHGDTLFLSCGETKEMKRKKAIEKLKATFSPEEIELLNIQE